MILLVGLGNPGEKHARHRHNVGFMAVDAIGDAHGFSSPRQKFHGEVREGFLGESASREKAVILKPLTYMNESGRSVGEAMRFYKLDPADVVVFYDELDLAPGKMRVKKGGGAAGHNGVRSVDAHLGEGFRRVRIGIGHPGDKSRVTRHVLGDFSKADQDWLQPTLAAIAAAAPFLTEDDQRFAADAAQRLVPAKRTASERRDAPPQNAKPKEERPAPAKNPFVDALQKLLGRED